MNTEWEKLKQEVNTYDVYLNEVEKVETYYDKIQSTTEQLCIRLYAYSANCAELILSSSKEYKDKYDDLEMIMILFMKMLVKKLMIEFMMEY